MDELQEVLAMVQRYFPEATIEDVEPIYMKIKDQSPNTTPAEIERIMKMIIPKIKAQMAGEEEQAPADVENKRAALKSLRGE